MTGPSPEGAAAEEFADHRERLVGLAYRLLGSRADAEDAVQEAWLRLARSDAATIDNLGGWLTTVVARICLDVLRSLRARPEASYEEWLPELVVTEDGGSAPEDDVLLAESLGLALLVVLDTLAPAERVAFILHDVFAVPFIDIGRVVGRSTDASKMLASRARRKVQSTPRPTTGRTQQRAVVEAFLAAARNGDFEGLLRVLSPDVTWRTHTARGVIVRVGAAEVAGHAKRAAGANGTAHPVLVNGGPGVLARATTGAVLGVMACTVLDGRVVAIVSVTDAHRLASITLPGRPGPTPTEEVS